MMLSSLTEGVYDGRWGGGWHGGPADGGAWWWIAWPVGWLLALALVGVGVWLIARAAGRRGAAEHPQPPAERARRILAERFARGEIDAEEYRNRLDGLA